ncbi:MAG: DUF3391 domain-containing protein, partial [Gammaproteobacteria bacterium]|nr:DUF3391 domain-containing protein [Gammaproteobacteria bacterium]
MKQKVSVYELREGMYVSELDRPWSEVGFEPPFELQGFTIASRGDIEKVQRICEYVYIDVPQCVDFKNGNDADQKSLAPQIVEHSGELRNVRYIKSQKYRKKKLEKDRESDTDLDNKQQRIESSLRGFKKWFPFSGGKNYQSAKDSPVVASCSYESGSAALKIHYDGNIEFRDEEQQLISEPLPEILSVYLGAATPNRQETDEDQSGYQDQSPFQEEITVAREILKDTQGVYAKIVKDIQAGRPFDADKVQHTVGRLVKSVVRNPDALGWLVRLKDRNVSTYFHSVAVSILSLTMGRHLGLPEEALSSLGTGTLLQDVGIVRIPRGVLNKCGELNSKERSLVCRHVDAATEMLGHQEFSTEIMDIVRSHHERQDGSGYPHGISGDLITPFSTIAGMADTYEALVSPRPHRPAQTSFDALTSIYGLGDKWFPKAMIEQFIECVGLFPLGSFVLLNTGHIGVVVGRNRIQQLRPKVLLLVDEQGNEIPNQSIDLATQPIGDDSVPWKILEVVEPEKYGLNPREF